MATAELRSLEEHNAEARENHLPFKHVGTIKVRLTETTPLVPSRLDVEEGDETFQHVPFEPAGEINVQFLEPTPMIPRKIEIEDDDE